MFMQPLSTCSQPRRSGFTLMELLVVVSIIGLLVAILMPIIGRARESSRRAKCSSNIGQIIKACQGIATMYQGTLDAPFGGGRLPAGCSDTSWAQNATIFAPKTVSGITVGTPRSYGYIYNLGLLTEKRTFYCPSWGSSFRPDVTSVSDNLALDWSNNAGGKEVWSHYGLRPGPALSAADTSNWKWDGDSPPDNLPTRSEMLSSNAYVTDIVIRKDSSNTVADNHGGGINVGKFDGSVVWVSKGKMQPELDAVNADVVGGDIKLMTPQLVPLWRKLDNQ